MIHPKNPFAPHFPSSPGLPGSPSMPTLPQVPTWPPLNPSVPIGVLPTPLLPVQPTKAVSAAVEKHPLYLRVLEALTSAPVKKGKGKKAKTTPRTHITFVLDSSGSMQDGKTITIGGYNDQVEIMQEQHEQAGETTVSLVLFNGNVETSYAYAEPATLQKLTNATYRPNGNTALYDAIGRAIDLMLAAKGFSEPDTAFFVAVFTDGEENASKDCFGELISRCIQKLEGTGRVTFSFMGPKEGLASITDVLKIAPGNVAGYDASSLQGRTMAFSSMSCATSNYMRARSAGNTAVNNLYSGQDTPPEDPKD